MATTSNLAYRIDLNLRSTCNDIADLPMYESDWESEPVHIRITLLYEWEDTIDRIEWLARRYDAGDMGDDQVKRYRDLISALRESVPILRRLEWRIPALAVEQSV